MTKDPILYIIGGANGSGKTTFAKAFVAKYNLPFINADEIAKALSPDNLEKARVQAGKQFLTDLKNHLKQKNTVAVESTLSGKTLLKHILKAKSLGYRIDLTYLYLNQVESNILRVKSRVFSGGHNVPQNDIIRRFGRSREQFWNIYRPECDQWTLIYFENKIGIEAAIGNKSGYTIKNNDLFTIFEAGMN